MLDYKKINILKCIFGRWDKEFHYFFIPILPITGKKKIILTAAETADETKTNDGNNNFYIGSRPSNQDSSEPLQNSGSESNISDWD